VTRNGVFSDLLRDITVRGRVSPRRDITVRGRVSPRRDITVRGRVSPRRGISGRRTARDLIIIRLKD
jgi:hypothetical protein